MKRALFLVVAVISLISCNSIQENPGKPEAKMERKQSLIEKPQETGECFPAFGSEFYKEKQTPFTDNRIILPEIKDDLLPEDPFLRMIALKKIYFHQISMKESPFSSNTPMALYTTDRFCIVGTLRGGVFQYENDLSYKGKMLLSPVDSLQNRSITQLVVHNDSLFISSFHGIVEYKTKQNQSSVIVKGSAKSSVLCLYRDDSSILYWGTSGGELYSRNGSDITLVSQADGSIRKIIGYGKYLLLGTGKGDIYVLDKMTGSLIRKVRLGSGRINDLLAADGKIFVASESGLYVYDITSDSLSLDLEDFAFRNMALSSHYIYCGTHSRGLVIYDRITDALSVWGLEKGLPSLDITCVGVADGKIFLGFPEKGILIIDEEILEKL